MRNTVCTSLIAILALIVVTLPIHAEVSGQAPPPVGRAPLPANWNVALRIERTKLAAGGVADVAHQSNWEIEVRDAAGRPQRDVPLELPVATPQNTAPSPAHAPEYAPRVEWQPGGTGITDKDGIARGIFTSGLVIEPIILQAKVFAEGTGPQVTIVQAWNELSDKEMTDGSDKNHNDNQPCKQRRTLAFRNGSRVVPITGHRLEFRPESVVLVISSGEPDRAPEEITVMANPDNADWKDFMTWSQFGPFTEFKPGVYEGSYIYHCPPLPPPDQQGKGVRYVVAVGRISYGVADRTVFLP